MSACKLALHLHLGSRVKGRLVPVLRAFEDNPQVGETETCYATGWGTQCLTSHSQKAAVMKGAGNPDYRRVIGLLPRGAIQRETLCHLDFAYIRSWTRGMVWVSPNFNKRLHCEREIM